MNNLDVDLFIAQHAPFDLLPDSVRSTLCNQIDIFYLTSDNITTLFTPITPYLMMVRSGMFEYQQDDETKLYGEGDIIHTLPEKASINVREPGLVYVFGEVTITELIQQFPDFAQRLTQQSQGDLIKLSVIENDWTQVHVGDQVKQAPVKIDVDGSILQASQLMAECNVSSLLVTENQQLVGIITDRDLRSRVLARGLDGNAAIADCMTADPLHLDQSDTLFDALNTMTRYNIHHLPIVKGEDRIPIGVVTSTDLIRAQRSDVMFLIAQLHKAKDINGLIEISEQLPESLRQFGLRTREPGLISELIAAYTDLLTQRLIDIYRVTHAIKDNSFVWLVFGSQARGDQMLNSDQDNALLISDECDLESRTALSNMASFVCEGLGQCGIPLCPGNIMASNPSLQLSLVEWQQRMKSWVNAPTPESILACQIYLDHRAVYGCSKLYKAFEAQQSQLFSQQIFIAALARQAQSTAVPIGLFNRFSLKKSDQGDKYIDVKQHGVAIVNDMIRVYALAHEISDVSTPERIKALKDHAHLSKPDADNLLDIWRFLNRLRVLHQLNHRADNHVIPDQLSSLHRHQLKEALLLIRESQQAMSMKFNRGL